MRTARTTREPSSSSTTSAGTSSAPLQLWPPAALLGLALPCRLITCEAWPAGAAYWRGYGTYMLRVHAAKEAGRKEYLHSARIDTRGPVSN